eukprot:c11466_g1_i1.p1 GENE.c11466_g1_i1~~c11466_g1_i1.p1  ORF type:complete len:752 (-),score=135.64 c11466_g1_i1:134-2389(-)
MHGSMMFGLLLLLWVVRGADVCGVCEHCSLAISGRDLFCCGKKCFLNDQPVCYIDEAEADDLPQCLCAAGYGGNLCNSSCHCAHNSSCDFKGFCDCNSQKCFSGNFTSCNNATNTPTCNCFDGWTGTICDECRAGHYGATCKKCPACKDSNSVCDDGIHGSGQCKCDDCRLIASETACMVMLCAAMLSVAILSARNAAKAGKHPYSQVHTTTRTLSMFLFAALLSRSLVIGINAAVNSQPRYDTVLEAVMDIPALVEIYMFVFLLAHVFGVADSKRRHDPRRAYSTIFMGGGGLAKHQTTSSTLSRNVRSISQAISHVVVLPHTREFANACVFTLLLLVLVCIPLLLNQRKKNYFNTARYALWLIVYTLIGVLYFIASCSFTNRASLSEIFWTRQRLTLASRTCQYVCCVRAIMLVIGLVESYKDLIRPSLSVANFAFEISYYFFTDFLPSLALLRLFRVEPLRFSVIADDLSTCFIPPTLLTIDHPLSAGSTGVVYTGRLLDLPVACKQQRVHDLRALTEVVNEATVLIHLRHQNVVAFYGLCLNHPHCYLVTERCDCSLASLLTEARLESIDRALVLKHVCDGMAYMHGKGMIHRDLKPENVLLQAGVAKICDFGTATMLRCPAAMTTRVGTPLFMAPEVLATTDHTPYTRHVDVFSFGVLLWCVACGKVPYSTLVTSNAWDLVRKVQTGQRPLRKEAGIKSDALWDLMERCWHADATKRPEFLEIRSELEAIFRNDSNALPLIVHQDS